MCVRCVTGKPRDGTSKVTSRAGDGMRYDMHAEFGVDDGVRGSTTHRSTLAGFPRRWTRFRGVLLPQPRSSPTALSAVTLSATATRSAIATTVATPLTTGLRMTTIGRPATSRLASHRVIILPTVTATQIAPTAPTVLTAPTATNALAVVNRCVSITALCRMRTGQVLVQSNSTRYGLTLARALQPSNDDETNN